MSLFRPLNEDVLEEGKRVSYKKYMRNGAAAYGSLGALGGGLAGAFENASSGKKLPHFYLATLVYKLSFKY